MFAIADPLSYVAPALGSVSFRSGSPRSAASFDDGKSGLESLAPATLFWIDLSAEWDLELTPEPTTVRDAERVETRYCQKVWPSEVEGRWAQICRLCANLSVTETFKALHEFLKRGGWRLDHHWPDEYEVTYRKPESYKDSFRLLFHRTSSATGIGILCGRPSDGSPLASHFMQVATADDFQRLVARPLA